MSIYPESEKLAEASKTTQPIGEFLDWLNGQGIQLMTWREDLTDSRPTDTTCRKRERCNRMDPCYPRSEHTTLLREGSDYYDTHCLHWHGREHQDGDGMRAERNVCCWCERGHHYEVTGLKSWVHDGRGFEQLLADYMGVDLKKVDAERRQMLADLRAANEAR